MSRQRRPVRSHQNADRDFGVSSRRAQEQTAVEPAGLPRAPARAPSSGSGADLGLWARHLAGSVGGMDAGEAFEQAASGGGGLPFQKEMEDAFGADLSGVKATRGQKETLDGIGAKAATDGERVAFADASPDKKTVAHEVAHVMQKRAGGGQGVRGKLSSAGDASEREADQVADVVAAGGPAPAVAGGLGGAGVLREENESSPDQDHCQEVLTPWGTAPKEAPLIGELLGHLGNTNLRVPIAFDQTIELGGASATLGVELDVPATAGQEQGVTGKVTLVTTGDNVQGRSSFDFATGEVGVGASIFGAGLDLTHGPDALTMAAKLDVLGAIFGDIDAIITRRTKGALKLSLSGGGGATAVWANQPGATPRITAMSANIGADLMLDPVAVAKTWQQEIKAAELAASTPEEEKEEHADGMNDMPGRDLKTSTDAKVTIGGADWTLTLSTDLLRQKMGGGAAFTVDTKEGADGQLETTTAKTSAHVTVAVGPIHLKITVWDDQGVAIGSPKERKELGDAVFTLALDEAFAAAGKEPTSLQDQQAMAQRINRRYRARMKHWMKQAKKRVSSVVKETDTGIEVTEYDVANLHIPMPVAEKRVPYVEHTAADSWVLERNFLSFVKTDPVRKRINGWVTRTGNIAMESPEDGAQWGQDRRGMDWAKKMGDHAKVIELADRILAADGVPKRVRDSAAKDKRKAEQALKKRR